MGADRRHRRRRRRHVHQRRARHDHRHAPGGAAARHHPHRADLPEAGQRSDLLGARHPGRVHPAGGPDRPPGARARRRARGGWRMIPRVRGALRAFPYWHELVLLALLGALLFYAHFTRPRFLTLNAQVDVASQVWELAILTLPMTLIIITPGIDLSVGSTMALSAVVVGLTWRAGIALPTACLFAIITGTLAGLLNGVLIAFVRVHPLIVTLATLSAYRGLA